MWTPTTDKIIVEKIDPDTTTTSGIILPESSTQHLHATVVSVGPDNQDVSVGDVVLYDKEYGTDLPKDPETPDNHMLLFGEDVIAVVS